MTFRKIALFTFVLLQISSIVSAQTGYQKPPQAVVDVLAAPQPPEISVSPASDYLLIMQPVRYPPIAAVAQPMARLAGLRIDTQTNGMHLAPFYTSLELRKIEGGTNVRLPLPANGMFSKPVWSDDGKSFAFMNTLDNGIELWIGDTASAKARRVEGVKVNGVRTKRGDVPMAWMADNQTLLARLIPDGRGAAPIAPIVPEGPHIQESKGKAGPVRTYEDMLASGHDEALLDYYATAQLASIDTSSGKVTRIGKPDLFDDVMPSPDGKYLLVERVHRPYSYLHPISDFPLDVEVWSNAGAKVFQVATLPLADRVPIGGVRTGARQYKWSAGNTPMLVWAEAMDGGNPKEKVPHRDRLLALAAPFTDQPHEVFKTEQRFMRLQPFEKSNLALVDDYDRDKRWLRTMQIDLSKPGSEGKSLFARNMQDRYKDPGKPVLQNSDDLDSPIKTKGDSMLLAGLGASPKGDRPFLDRYDLASQQAKRVFQSEDGAYEVVEAVLDNDGSRIITRRESSTEPPNYYLRAGSSLTKLTNYSDPNPKLSQIKKQLITYKREDGVPLSFILYTPPDYKPGTKLPTLLWAYPLEFNDADTAGQVSGSTNRFPLLTGHLLFLMHGYAVLENASMPIVGDPETVNNTYVKQLVMNGKAAIDKAVEIGVADRNRVGVGGHSYGAFMTVNLLANSDLFRAGMAESGAYNRTLTPFGFQSERRTIWQAPEIYMTMSPFMHAPNIKEPLLMIHGEADDNSGTFPIQSERLYQAIRGNGGTVRLVMLPSEAHAYRALETQEHVLYEELRWMDKYLKDEQPAEKTSTQ